MFVDWSQNSRHKTTVAALLAAGPAPPHGVDAGDLGGGRAAAADGEPLGFETADVLDRVEDHGDLFAGTARATPSSDCRGS